MSQAARASSARRASVFGGAVLVAAFLTCEAPFARDARAEDSRDAHDKLTGHGNPRAADVLALGRANEADTTSLTFIESTLPVPHPPAVLSSEAPITLPAGDAASEPARAIQRRVRRFPNLRALTPGATWSVHEERVWHVRRAAQCERELSRLGVPHRALERSLSTPVAVPVVITGRVGGVRFAVAQHDRELELSCEMAARLPQLAQKLSQFQVTEVSVVSSYRDHPTVSFHTFGFALDMAAFTVQGRVLSVAKHFEQTPDVATCAAAPVTDDGRTLLNIACAIADSHTFSSVLTPNYNAGHRDHFHVDIRPDDARFFVR